MAVEFDIKKREKRRRRKVYQCTFTREGNPTRKKRFGSQRFGICDWNTSNYVSTKNGIYIYIYISGDIYTISYYSSWASQLRSTCRLWYGTRPPRVITFTSHLLELYLLCPSETQNLQYFFYLVPHYQNISCFGKKQVTKKITIDFYPY